MIDFIWEYRYNLSFKVPQQTKERSWFLTKDNHNKEKNPADPPVTKKHNERDD